MKKIVTIILIVLAVVFGIILAGYIYLNLSAPHLFKMSEKVSEKSVTLVFEDLKKARFIDGMKGCENIYVDPFSMKVYVTDLTGYVHLLDGDSWQDIDVVKSKKLGDFALGIDKGPDGYLYIGASTGNADEWIKKGGPVFRVDMALETAQAVTGDYPAINGLAFDNRGNCFFASSNFDFLAPKGAVYIMAVTAEGIISAPRIFIENAGLANGLYYDKKQDLLYLSNTIEGVFTFSAAVPEMTPVYYKTQPMEAADDICSDDRGRLWMTDPGPGGCTIKMFDPATRTVTRYFIDGIGQTSSCRIRDGVLYLTEIKETAGSEYDGRGVVVVSIGSLGI